MTTRVENNGPGSVPISRADIQTITSALLGLTIVSETITAECFKSEPPSDSYASGVFYSYDQDSGEKHVLDAFLYVQYSNLNGFDHVRALVALLRANQVRTTALATLTRSALEAFSRSWFLLSTEWPGTLTHRLISLLHAELKYPELYELVLHTNDGDPVDPKEKRIYYRNELKRLGLPAAVKIEFSQLVADLLNHHLDGESGLERYSDLSAIAHGLRLGVNSFVARNDEGAIERLIAPRDLVMNWATEIVVSMSAPMDALIEAFGEDTRHQELFRTAKLRAVAAIESISLVGQSDEQHDIGSS
jgi:hypothetical protein